MNGARAATTTGVTCVAMTGATRDEALALLALFLQGDSHYLAPSAAYGDGDALARSLDEVRISLLLDREPADPHARRRNDLGPFDPI